MHNNLILALTEIWAGVSRTLAFQSQSSSVMLVSFSNDGHLDAMIETAFLLFFSFLKLIYLRFFDSYLVLYLRRGNQTLLIVFCLCVRLDEPLTLRVFILPLCECSYSYSARPGEPHAAWSSCVSVFCPCKAWANLCPPLFWGSPNLAFRVPEFESDPFPTFLSPSLSEVRWPTFISLLVSQQLSGKLQCCSRVR